MVIRKKIPSKRKGHRSMEKIFQSVRFFVKLGYLWHVIPMDWNREERKIMPCKSKLQTSLYHFSTVVVFVTTASQICTIVQDTKNENLTITGHASSFRIMYCIGTTFATIWRLNTILYADLIMELINGGLKDMISRWKIGILPSIGKIERMNKLLLALSGYVLVIGTPFLFLFAINCNTTYISGPEVICTRNEFMEWEHKSIWIVALYAIISTYTSLQHMCTTSFYGELASLSVLHCYYGCLVDARIFTDRLHKITKLSDPHFWIRAYKSTLILMKQSNDALYLFIPSGLLMMIVFMVGNNYVLLATDAPFYLKTPLGMLNIFIALWLVLIIQLGASLPGFSEKLVALKRSTIKDIDKALSYDLKCCTPLQIKVGSFDVISSMSVTILGQTVLDHTITVIMTF